MSYRREMKSYLGHWLHLKFGACVCTRAGAYTVDAEVLEELDGQRQPEELRVVIGAVPGKFRENAVRIAVRYHQWVQSQPRLLLLTHSIDISPPNVTKQLKSKRRTTHIESTQ